jgi:hypothetical protein
MDPMPPEGGSEVRAGRSAAVRPRGIAIEHCVDIAAPAEVAWELVSDLQGWSQWNPLYRQAGGSLEVGETISMIVTIPGTRPVDIRPKVVAAVANELVHYQEISLGGLLRGTRYIEIERSGTPGCHVLNGEIMGGLLGRLMAHAAGDRVRMGLEMMSEALKKVAEARWQGRSALAYSTDVPGA